MPAHPSLRLAPRRLALVGVAALAVAACSSGGSGASGPVPESAAPSGRPEVTSGIRPTVAPSGAPVTGEVPAEVMAAVTADLSARTGKDAAAATVTKAEAVTWPDGSLGCPQPGVMYTQIVTPGYQVILELDGTTYDYRVSGEGTTIRLCEGLKPAGGDGS
jgi:hypothetical protein